MGCAEEGESHGDCEFVLVVRGRADCGNGGAPGVGRGRGAQWGGRRRICRSGERRETERGRAERRGHDGRIVEDTVVLDRH